nr:transposase (putative), gypsy type [Tanacetum cinerariifolium]
MNRTLVEAARTMLSAAKVPLDGENLDKMKKKGDACIFVGYSTQSRAYRVFNKRTRVIVKTIHVNFDELPQLASDHASSDPVPQCQRTALEHNSLSPGPQCQENVPLATGTVTTSNELDLLYSPMFNELLTGSTQVVSKSSAETTADASNKSPQQHTTPLNTQTTPEPTCQVPTQAPTITSTESINQAEMITENAQVKDDEFINIFYTSVQDRGETSSRHVDSSNMHAFYQRHPSEHLWTKDHPLEQVIRNHSQSVRTRRQLESDGEMWWTPEVSDVYVTPSKRASKSPREYEKIGIFCEWKTNSTDDEASKIEEDAKAEAAKRESEVRKEELVDLLGPKDSHHRLFFECGFSLRIWNHFKDMIRLENAPNSYNQIILYLYNKPVNRLRYMANGFNKSNDGPAGDGFMSLKRIYIVRLKFCYLFVLPSSFVVTYASAMLPCIDSTNQTIHEMPAGKIGVYTRFFEYANFRLPLSTFLVNVLKHYRIHISQLSIIGAAKVSHLDIICRVHGFEPTIGLFRCFYVNSKNKGWMSFSKRQEIDLLSCIRTADPTKVRIGERQRDEDEPKLLETTVRRVVPLLLVAPDCSSGELEASVENLFGEGRSGEQAKQGDSESGGHGVGIDLVVETSVEDMASAASSGPTVGGKSQSLIQRLLVGAVQNAKVRGVNIVEAEVDSGIRTSMPIITIATTTTPTVDLAAIPKEKLVGSYIFGADSPSVGRSHPIPGGFSDCSGRDFLIGGIRTVINPDSNLQKVYVPQWNVTNGFCLDDSGACREMVDEFSPPKFFAFVRGMDHDQLFTEFNIGAARQIYLSAEVRMRAEYNIKERMRLNSMVEEKDSLLKSMCEEIESLKAQLLVKEIEAADVVHLRVEASKFKI